MRPQSIIALAILSTSAVIAASLAFTADQIKPESWPQSMTAEEIAEYCQSTNDLDCTALVSEYQGH